MIVTTRSRQTAGRSGPATVRLTNGNTYVGHAVYDGRAVTIRGRLQVTAYTAEGRTVSYRQRVDRTVPVALVREVIWTARVPSDTVSQPAAGKLF